MNYDELSQEDAMDLIRDTEGDLDERLEREIIEPRDVLYYLDAFGDLSLAINCQGLPKDLPDDVIEAIDEYDVFNDWQGSIGESLCPICGREFYEFDFDTIYPTIDEYGDNHDYIEHISDKAGNYWNAAGDEHLMCQSCREPPNFSRMDPKPTVREVRVFYGESDEFSRFSHQSGVIRWDFWWDMDYGKSTDLFNLRAKDNGELISGHEIAKSFAEGHSNRNAMMERLGFQRIHVKEIDQLVMGVRRFWRYAKEVLEGWATLDSKTMTEEPTHPDLDFTYLIEGQYQAWVPEEYFEKFKAELVWQSLREASDYEKAEAHRVEYDSLLSFDWEAA